MSDKRNPDRIHLSQVLAGALAAVTAALLGSTMGVAGTVAGAGLASVVSTVGGALYLRSIQRTRQGVRTVREKVTNRTNDFGELMPLASDPDPEDTTDATAAHRGYATDSAADREGATDAAAGPASGSTPTAASPANASADADSANGPVGTDAAGGADLVEEPTTRGGPPDFQLTGEDRQFLGPREEPTRRLRWATIIVSSVLAFALGMLAITGFEWLRGESLSGGEGTSFGNIVRPQHDDDRAPERDDSPDPTTPPSTGPTTSEPKPPPTTTPSTESTPPTTSETPPTTTSETPPPGSQPSLGPTPPAGDAG